MTHVGIRLLKRGRGGQLYPRLIVDSRVSVVHDARRRVSIDSARISMPAKLQ